MHEPVALTAEEEVDNWLNVKGLSKYASLLNLNGYKRFADCVGLTSAKLRQLGLTDDRDIQVLLILGKQRRVPLPPGAAAAKSTPTSSQSASQSSVTQQQELTATPNSNAEAISDTAKFIDNASSAADALEVSATGDCEVQHRRSADNYSYVTQPATSVDASVVASSELAESAELIKSNPVSDNRVHRSAGFTKSVIRVDPMQIAFESITVPNETSTGNVVALEDGPLVMMKPKLDVTTGNTNTNVANPKSVGRPLSPRPVVSAPDLVSMATPTAESANVEKSDGSSKDGPGSRRAEVLISVPDHGRDITSKHNVFVKVSDRTPRDEFSLEYRERCLLPVNMQIRTLGLAQDNVPVTSRRKVGTVRVIRASGGDNKVLTAESNTSVDSASNASATPSTSRNDAATKTNQQSTSLLVPPSPRRKAAAESGDESDFDEIDSGSRTNKVAPISAGSDAVVSDGTSGHDRQATKMVTGYLTLLPANLAVSGTFWAVFDGTDLRLFKNDKAHVSKRVVPMRVVEKAVALTIDRTRFALITPGGQFPFDTAKGEEGKHWLDAIDAVIRNKAQASGGREPLRVAKEGWLTIERDTKRSFLASSDRTRKFAVIYEGLLQVYDSAEEARTECPIYEMRMELASVKLVINTSNKVDHTKLQLVNARAVAPYILSFENANECDEWNKALQHAILVALDKMGNSCDGGRSTTLFKIYENPSNHSCADCGTSDPEWASINLGIMICDRCAGCHRQLSVSYSKVQSVRLDTRIWTNTTIMIMTTIGNANANRFWEGTLPSDFVRSAWTVDDNKRSEFIRNKYVEKRYCAFHSFRGNERQLGEELCDVIRDNDRTLIQAMELLFSGASLSYETVEAGVPTSVMQLAIDKKRFLLSEFFVNNQNIVTGPPPVATPAAVAADIQSAKH